MTQAGRFSKIKQTFADLELFSSANIMAMRAGMIAIKFILALFIVRHLGLEQMGLFGLLGGAVAIVPALFRTGLFSYISRKAVSEPRAMLCRDLYHYGVLSLALYTLSLPIVISAGLYWERLPLFLLGYAVIFGEHLAYDVFTLTNHLGKTYRANLFLALQTLLWAVLYMGLALPFPALRTLECLCLFWGAGTCILLTGPFFSIRLWPWAEAFSAGISKEWYRSEFILSWRIYASDLVSTLSLYVDRYLVGLFLNLEMVGIYTLFWQAANAICNLVGASVLQPYRPRLIAAYRRHDAGDFRFLFWQSAAKSLFSTALLGIASILVMPFLIRLTDAPLAFDYLPLFSLMMVALLFRIGTDVAGYTLYAAHQDQLVLYSGIIKLALSISGSILFLWWFGLYGIVPAIILVGSGAILYAAYEWKERKFI